MKYDKLIRDNIPEIIEKSGRTCETEILSDEEYERYLNLKLKEETEEYLKSFEIEELADLEEVLRAILDTKGAFSKKLLLKRVD